MHVVPERDRLPVRDVERLAGRLEWVRRLACEVLLRQRVVFRPPHRPHVLFRVRVQEGGLELGRVLGRGDGGPDGVRLGGRNPLFARREGDGRERVVADLFPPYGACGRVEGFCAEFVGGEEVGFYDVSDVGPVPEIRVVPDLPLCLAPSDHLSETFKVLSVSWAKRRKARKHVGWHWFSDGKDGYKHSPEYSGRS